MKDVCEETDGVSTSVSCSRRTCLKLAGTAVTVSGIATGPAVAGPTDGYGVGGYGAGAYGSPGELLVSTDGAIVGETTATLDGSLGALGDADSASVGVQYRRVNVSSWSSSATETLSETGSFSVSLSGLTDGVEYQYRAVASTSDGDTATGSIVSFTTAESSVGVQTDGATDVTETTATFNGSLTDLGNADSADAGFEYRAIGSDSWTETSTQTLSSTGSFSESAFGLPSGTDCEVRARCSAADGDSDTGSLATFRTKEATIELEDSHTITIEGPSDGPRDYEFAVEADLAKDDAMGATIDSNDTIDGTTASGTVYGGRDSYTYTGSVTWFDGDDGLTVYIDGSEVDPATLGETHTITIESPDGSNRNYEFAVEADLAKDDAMNASINDGDTIDGTTATGSVYGGRDSYTYTGNLVRFAGEDVTVYIDGSEVDPATLVETHTVTIESSDTSYRPYEFGVGGNLAKDDALGATFDDNDTIDGTTASGSVAGGRDSYTYTGTLTWETRNGVTAFVDGHERNA